MKIKYAIGILIVGFCITLYGSLQKILHTPSADAFLKIGLGITVVGFILLLYKLFKDALA
jgi:hypothetical protein